MEEEEGAKAIEERCDAPACLASERSFCSSAAQKRHDSESVPVLDAGLSARARTQARRARIGTDRLGVPNLGVPIGAALVNIDELDQLGVDSGVAERFRGVQRVVEVKAAREAQVVEVGEFCLDGAQR